MKKRMLGSLLAAMFVVGLMAPAAFAEVDGVAVFTGTANVGKSFNPACTKLAGTATGIGLPLVPAPNQDVHTWDLTGAQFDFVGKTRGGVGQYHGGFHVCGWMDGPLPGLIGASCLSTKGYHGRGQATGTNVNPPGDQFKIKLYNVGWKLAVGAILPVTGNYQMYEADGVTKKTTKTTGSIYALVGAAPVNVPDDCLNQPAQNFTIAGAALLAQDGVDHGKAQPPAPMRKKCADGMPNSCPDPGPGK